MKPDKPLKIGLVMDEGLDKPDGVQQYILAVGEWLRSQTHEVHYLVGQTTRKDLTNVHSLSRNIGVRFNGNRNTMPLPTSTASLRAFLQAHSFDVLHVQAPYSPFLAHRLIKAADQKTAIIGTFHVAPNGKLMTLGTTALGIWLRSSLKRFDRMLSVSSTAAEFAKQTFKVESDISPNVINYPEFHNAQPLTEYNDDTLTVVFLGRLVQRKGCQLLLEAIVKLEVLPDLPDYRVVICGKGHLEAGLKKYVIDHNLQNRVSFVGFVSEADKPRYYASADISVFPSSGGESFGIVLLEAMASGNAVVLAGDNPGYRSVIGDQPELLFDPYDAAQLADKIALFMHDKAGRKQLANWGEQYTAQFDIETVGRQLLTIYEQALHKRRNT